MLSNGEFELDSTTGEVREDLIGPDQVYKFNRVDNARGDYISLYWTLETAKNEWNPVWSGPNDTYVEVKDTINVGGDFPFWFEEIRWNLTCNMPDEYWNTTRATENPLSGKWGFAPYTGEFTLPGCTDCSL